MLYGQGALECSHRKEGVNGDSPEEKEASCVDNSGRHSAESEEGDDDVESEDQADEEDGEEGAGHVDQHVLDDDSQDNHHHGWTLEK